MKIYDGTTWQEAKSLKIHNGSAWVNAVKSWVYNGSWQLVYPNSPISTGGPTPFIYSGKTYPSPGSVWTPTHSWNMDPAYAPTSYTYQWKRNNVNISGATSPTYTATVADIDSTIGVSITATNGRGSTTISGNSGTIILPMVSSVIAYDSTPYPTQPSVSLYPSNLNFTGSWGTSTYATSYEISTNNGSVSPTFAVSSGNFTGSGSAGPVQITVTPTNSNKQVYIYWSAAEGASSYDIVKYGNNVQTTINVPSSQTTYTWPIDSGNESNYFSVYPRSASYQGYGIQTTATASNKTANPGYASGTLVSVPAPSGGSVSLAPAGTQQAGTTIYASTSASSWSGSPTVFEIKILKATGTPPTESGGNATSNGTVTATSTSHTITTGEASGTPDQFTAFARAYNDGGWSGWVASNTVVSTPVPVVVTYTATYNANGGSGGGTSTYTAGGITYAPSAPSRSGYTFNGWYDTSALDWSYFANAGGGWYPPSRDITMVARWTAVVSGTAPTISVSNSYDGRINNLYQWTLTINNTSSTAATSYSWGVQFSATNGGTVIASATGSGGSIPAGGSVTVTRNHATASWARWVSVVASNGYGSSSTLSTGWA